MTSTMAPTTTLRRSSSTSVGATTTTTTNKKKATVHKRLVTPTPSSSNSSSKKRNNNNSTSPQEWDVCFAQLQAFHKTHGHAIVPVWHATLGDWCRDQCDKLARNQLSPSRRALLQEIGLQMETRDSQLERIWQDRFQRLKAWKEKHGHLLITEGNKNDDSDRQLGKWAGCQRRYFYQKKLSKERIELLNSVGFVWSIKEVQAALQQQQEEEEEAELESTGAAAGKKKTNNKLSQEEKAQQEWDDFYQQLAEFYHDQGHFLVPRDTQPELHAWMQEQRRLHQTSQLLSKPRQEKLEELDFIWCETKATNEKVIWDANFETLKAFRARMEHTYVQREDDLQLWRWAEYNDWKQRKGKLPRRLNNRLDSIGFWDPPPPQSPEPGEEEQQQLTDQQQEEDEQQNQAAGSGKKGGKNKKQKATTTTTTSSNSSKKKGNGKSSTTAKKGKKTKSKPVASLDDSDDSDSDAESEDQGDAYESEEDVETDDETDEEDDDEDDRKPSAAKKKRQSKPKGKAKKGKAKASSNSKRRKSFEPEEDDDDDEDEDDEKPPAKRPKKGKGKKKGKAKKEEPEDDDDDEEPLAKRQKTTKATKRNGKAKKVEESDDDEEEEEDRKPAAAKGRVRKVTLHQLEQEMEEEGSKKPAKKGVRKVTLEEMEMQHEKAAAKAGQRKKPPSRKAKKEEEEEDDDDNKKAPASAAKGRKKATKRKARVEEPEAEEGEDGKPAAKRQRRRNHQSGVAASASVEESDAEDSVFTTPYQVGTKVLKYFNKHGWFEGEIISIYQGNLCKIRYEDQDEETFEIPKEAKDLDAIIANAQGTRQPRYKIGTAVKKFFEGHGWFDGKVVGYEEEEEIFKVRYKDGDQETYQIPKEQDELDQIVSNAIKLHHKIGTNVKKHFKGNGWFEGKIVKMDDDRYLVRYDDGDEEEYLFENELGLLDSIVGNARSQ